MARDTICVSPRTRRSCRMCGRNTRPHTFGVSYFSSRGPTGDGRLKPDLVAPGEKIDSLAPDNGLVRKDGTSMAAPHASGAAALLMARHREFLGQPSRVKASLCESATDLGRERQGIRSKVDCDRRGAQRRLRPFAETSLGPAQAATVAG